MRFVVLLSFLFSVLSISGQNYKNVDAVAFKALVENGNGVLLDVRTKKEFDRGYIKGAKLVDIRDRVAVNELLSLPKGKPVYVYCYSGARSRSVATFLSQNGFADVVNLAHGIIDWNRNSFPLEKKQEQSEILVDEMTALKLSQITSANQLVFVDFYAPWCAPCKKMLPIVEELSEKYKNKVEVVKVNADTSGELMKRLDVRGVPFLMLYKNGAVVFTASGAMEREEIVNLLEKHLQ